MIGVFSGVEDADEVLARIEDRDDEEEEEEEKEVDDVEVVVARVMVIKDVKLAEEDDGAEADVDALPTLELLETPSPFPPPAIISKPSALFHPFTAPSPANPETSHLALSHASTASWLASHSPPLSRSQICDSKVAMSKEGGKGN